MFCQVVLYSSLVLQFFCFINIFVCYFVSVYFLPLISVSLAGGSCSYQRAPFPIHYLLLRQSVQFPLQYYLHRQTVCFSICTTNYGCLAFLYNTQSVRCDEFHPLLYVLTRLPFDLVVWCWNCVFGSILEFLCEIGMI